MGRMALLAMVLACGCGKTSGDSFGEPGGPAGAAGAISIGAGGSAGDGVGGTAGAADASIERCGGCPPDRFCSPSGRCLPVGTCATADDCSEGRTCSRGRCVDPTNCDGFEPGEEEFFCFTLGQLRTGDAGPRLLDTQPIDIGECPPIDAFVEDTGRVDPQRAHYPLEGCFDRVVCGPNVRASGRTADGAVVDELHCCYGFERFCRP